MKIRFQHIKMASLALCTVLIFGCEQGLEPEIPVKPDEYTFIITAADASDATKSGYNPTEGKIYWTSGDKIGVFVANDVNNKNKEYTQVDGTSGDYGIKFEGTLTGITPGEGAERTIYAYYPYNSDNDKSDLSGSVLTIDFPAVQEYHSDRLFSDLPSVGRYEGSVDNISVTFRNMYTVLKLPISSEQYKGTDPQLTAIKFKSNGSGEKVAGPMSIDMSQGDGTSFTPNYSGLTESEIILTVANVPLTSTAGYFYIGIPSMNYTSGFTITIETNVGIKSFTFGAKDLTSKRNKILAMTPFELSDFSIATRFARSNIVWDATNNKLTFAVTPEDNATIPANSQGVLFQWGSLVAISPATLASQSSGTTTYVAGRASTGAGHIVYSPTGTYTYAWASIPYISSTAVPFNNNNATEDDFATYNSGQGWDANGRGDICRYITSQGWVRGQWRLPTADEYDQLLAELTNGVSNGGGFIDISVSPSTPTTNHYGYYQPSSGRWLGSGATTSSGVGSPSVGAYSAAGGRRWYTDGSACDVGKVGFLWTGSDNTGANGAILLVQSTGSQRLARQRQSALAVRCVRE